MEEVINPIQLEGGYCNSLTQYSRFLTREVKIGNIPMGGLNPIRIQSMTTTDTMDTLGTVEQTIRMVDSGCDYVRITAPSIKPGASNECIRLKGDFPRRISRALGESSMWSIAKQ